MNKVTTCIGMFFAICIAIYLSSAQTITVIAASEGNYEYYVSNGEAQIYKYNSYPSGNITIPSTLGGYPVTSISSNVFYDCDDITGVTIPDTVTYIASNAFGYCDKLTNITIPDNLTNLRDAFNETAWYRQQPDGLVYLGKVAYKYKGDAPANGNIAIKNGTVGIAVECFSNISGITEIYIPETVTVIGSRAFNECSDLVDINVNLNNENYLSENGVLFNKDKTSLIQYPAAKSGKYAVPEGVTYIGNRAFWRCEQLSKITFPDSLTDIENAAFSYCSGLKELDINNVYRVGTYAFEYCTALENVDLDCEWLCSYVFDECTSLKNVTLGKCLKSINTDPFRGCVSLEKVYLNCEYIELSYQSGIFNNLGSIKTVFIGGEVKRIPYAAFDKCTGITNVYFYGTKNQWNNVNIENENECLTNAQMYFMPVKLDFDANGGNNAPEIQYSALIPLDIPERFTYKFLGWTEDINSETAKYQPGDEIVITADEMVLYAVWEKEIYTSTSVSKGSGYKIYNVTVNNIPSESIIMLVGYKGNVLTHIEIRRADNTIFMIPDNVDYDAVKVFAWDAFSDMSPITEVEDVEV